MMASVLDHVPRHPFSLDPLIAEARRRARQRRALLVTAVLVAAGGAAAGEVLTSTSSYAASRPLRAALARSPLLGASVAPSFVPRATFGMSFVLTDEAGAAVALEDVRAVLPHPSPLRQIGIQLTAFEPVQCPGGCPPGTPRFLSPPYGPERPAPLGLAPGQMALAQLNFRFVACWNKPLPWRPVVRQVIARYLTSGGTVIHQRIALGMYSVGLTGMNTSHCRG
jgi:hypothetical protein